MGFWFFEKPRMFYRPYDETSTIGIIMLFFKRNKPAPLRIVVKEGYWDAFGPQTVRSQWLYNLLVKEGGIAESVTDGTYHYNVEKKGFRLYTTLTKVED